MRLFCACIEASPSGVDAGALEAAQRIVAAASAALHAATDRAAAERAPMPTPAFAGAAESGDGAGGASAAAQRKLAALRSDVESARELRDSGVVRTLRFFAECRRREAQGADASHDAVVAALLQVRFYIPLYFKRILLTV